MAFSPPVPHFPFHLPNLPPYRAWNNLPYISYHIPYIPWHITCLTLALLKSLRIYWTGGFSWIFCAMVSAHWVYGASVQLSHLIFCVSTMKFRVTVWPLMQLHVPGAAELWWFNSSLGGVLGLSAGQGFGPLPLPPFGRLERSRPGLPGTTQLWCVPQILLFFFIYERVGWQFLSLVQTHHILANSPLAHLLLPGAWLMLWWLDCLWISVAN